MKVVVVTGICIERDAISAAAADQAEMFASLEDVDDVVLISQYHSREAAVRQVTVANAWSLVAHPEIADADLVVFHWGIQYRLFDALPIIQYDTQAVVYFQNLTPLEMLDVAAHPLHAESLAQMQLPGMFDTPIWTASQYNVETLRASGFPEQQIVFVPFPITPPRVVRNRTSSDRVRLLVVGRLVAAKGVDVLVESMRTVVDELGDHVSLLILGSAQLSGGGFTDGLRSRLTELGLDRHVQIQLDADDETLWDAYESADILVSPSLHEGLCVPVVEAYHAGCRVVGTDAGNLPHVVLHPDPLVPPGDSAALAKAILSVAHQVMTDTSSPPPGVAKLLDCYSAASTRTALRTQIDKLFTAG